MLPKPPKNCPSFYQTLDVFNKQTHLRYFGAILQKGRLSPSGYFSNEEKGFQELFVKAVKDKNLLLYCILHIDKFVKKSNPTRVRKPCPVL